MRNRHAPWFVPRAVALLAFIAAAALCRAQVLNAPAPQSPPPLTLQGLGRATQPVDGNWQFHTGDDPAWASPTFDDSGWEPIQVGRPWEGQGHRNYTGFAWYRRHLALAPGQSKDWNLALFVPAVDSACEVYWNGVLVGSLGKVPPHPVWYFPKYRPTGVFPLGPAQSGVLAIRVWKAPIVLLSFPEEGGLISVPQAGSTEAIAGLNALARYKLLKENQFSLALVLLSSIVGLLALLTWLRNRKSKVLLWLALAMFFPLEAFLVHLLPLRFGYGLVQVPITLNDMALWFLLLALLGLNDRRQLVRWTIIFVCAEFALDLVEAIFQIFDLALGHPQLFLIADIGSNIPYVAIQLWGLVLVIFALRQRLDAARWMLAISALLTDLIQAADDITALGLRWTHLTLRDTLGAPLLTIAGSPLNARTITDTFFLVSILYVAWRYSVEQSQQKSALEQEYRSAQELQQVLIPEALPELPGYTVTSAYRPALEVGGDFFQLMALPDNGALLVIGDVSGKGLPAAMAVALIVGAIRSTVEATDDPVAMLAVLNRRLHGRLRGGFATCLVMRLDANGNCLIASAGHLPPFLDGEEVPPPPALPLGLLPESEYEPIHLRIPRGSRLTLYTDGLLEARNADGELFGFARIAGLLATSRDAQQIADAAQEFGQEDDITVLTITLDAEATVMGQGNRT